MERTELRLELLKLTHTHAHSAEEAIGRARKYEDFILEAQAVASEAPAKAAGGRKPEKVGNPKASQGSI